MLGNITGWHLILIVFWLAPFVLWLIALIQIAQSKASGGTIALWVVITTLVPLIGAILWFAIGKRTATQVAPDGPPPGGSQAP